MKSEFLILTNVPLPAKNIRGKDSFG